jgi:predicted enzyme related to lactoylglutathione lyase
MAAVQQKQGFGELINQLANWLMIIQKKLKNLYTMFKKLRTVVYHVADIEKAKAWYSNITGVQPYFDEVFYVGFDINGSEMGLDPDMTGVQAGNQSVAYWAVDDIEGCVQKLAAAGATIAEAVNEVGGGVKVASITDPWGNTVGLIEGA